MQNTRYAQLILFSLTLFIRHVVTSIKTPQTIPYYSTNIVLSNVKPRFRTSSSWPPCSVPCRRRNRPGPRTVSSQRDFPRAPVPRPWSPWESWEAPSSSVSSFLPISVSSVAGSLPTSRRWWRSDSDWDWARPRGGPRRRPARTWADSWTDPGRPGAWGRRTSAESRKSDCRTGWPASSGSDLPATTGSTWSDSRSSLGPRASRGRPRCRAGRSAGCDWSWVASVG